MACTVFNREDTESKAKAHWSIKTLIKECAEHGWGEYRTHLALMDQIAETYCFNHRALMKRNERTRTRWIRRGCWRRGRMGFGPKGMKRMRLGLRCSLVWGLGIGVTFEGPSCEIVFDLGCLIRGLTLFVFECTQAFEG